MLDSMSGNHLPYVSLEQALINIIDSISMEEAAISGIMRAEGALIQKTKCFADSVENFVALNISVNDMMKNLVRLQLLLQLKLEEAQRFIHKDDDSDEFEE